MATLHTFTGEEVIATELPQLLNQNFDYVNDNRIKTVNSVEYDANNNIDVTHLVSQSIVSGTDLNTLTTSGEYVRLGSVTKLLNSPSDHPFFLTVLASDGLVKQVLTELIVNNPTTFTRTMNGAQWSSWISLTYATQGEAEAGTDNTKVMTPLRVRQAKKQYTSFDQLGLDSGCTFTDIFDALTNKGGFAELEMYVGKAADYPNMDLPFSNYTRILFKNVDSVVHCMAIEGGSAYNVHEAKITANGFFGWKKLATTDEVAHLLQNNTSAQTIVGYKNSIYRGKYLGSSLTSAQSATIRAGVFDDLFIGDYWTIGGVNYRIASFDYYYNCGDTACTTHHVVVVPDTILYSAQMNAENVTTGAYVGSAMYTTNLAQAKTTIGNAFGTDHLLTIRQYFSNAVTDGYESGGAWTDATVWLMNEHNVYGSPVFNNCIQGTSWANRYTIDNSQYPLFAMNPRMIHTRQTYWLRDVASSAHFAGVYGDGGCSYYHSSSSLGVRPAFLVY